MKRFAVLALACLVPACLALAGCADTAPVRHAAVPAVAAPPPPDPQTQMPALESRIAAAGYTDVGALVKDKDGIWRGTATKDGAQANVGLDYQGNVVVTP